MADAAPLSLDLPFPPSSNNLFVNGRRGRFVSPAYAAWKKEAGAAIKQQIGDQAVSGPYALQIRFVRPSRRRMDLDNRVKAVIDLLAWMKVTDDDSELQSLRVRWVADGPACWVAIRPCARWGEPDA